MIMITVKINDHGPTTEFSLELEPSKSTTKMETMIAMVTERKIEEARDVIRKLGEDESPEFHAYVQSLINGFNKAHLEDNG